MSAEALQNKKHAKYIFVSGGVTSSLGKGITAASLGCLLKARGLRVAMQKFDPYININPGMMSPLQHGEVFVTADGGECDLDVGHYERFINEKLTVDSDVTSGQIYQNVINKERNGDYNGGTVQVIPHITDEIKKTVYRVARLNEADVVIIEIGGTVGDIESQPFLEAARQVKWEVGEENCLYIHVTLVPYLSAAGELKTKPTQHSVKELRSIGIQPDLIVCRTEMPLSKQLRDKIGLFCNVDGRYVIANYDAESLYDLPMMMRSEGLDELVCKKLEIDAPPAQIDTWEQMAHRFKNPTRNVRVALVGKYVDLHDAYLSVMEALAHAGIVHDASIEIDWVYSGDIHTMAEAESILGAADAIIIPGGFGERGTGGMIRAARYAREAGIPYLGLGLGMQMAVVSFARDVCGLDADSTEINPNTPHPVIAMMGEYKEDGSMRLGEYTITFTPGSIAARVYGVAEAKERHRNRYEVNPAYADKLAEKGMIVGGINRALDLIEEVELLPAQHPFYVGVLYHAEFNSRPNHTHPLFCAFVEAALARKER